MYILFKKYGVVYRVFILYYFQINGQAEIFNREIKRILEKIVQLSRKDWSIRFDDVFWVYRIVYKVFIGMFFYRVVFGKVCYFSVEIEYKVYWAVKICNFFMD